MVRFNMLTGTNKKKRAKQTASGKIHTISKTRPKTKPTLNDSKKQQGTSDKTITVLEETTATASRVGCGMGWARVGVGDGRVYIFKSPNSVPESMLLLNTYFVKLV